MSQNKSSMVERSGYVALIGRPNVGKSTILNHILGQKISITSRKPQTTRHRVLGIKTEGLIQAMYVDTPGLHKEQKKAINRYMNRAASSSIKEVDVIVFVVEKLQWTDEDQLVLEQLMVARCPVILAVNKVDQIEDKQKLLPFLQKLTAKMDFKAIVPVSALDGHNLSNLEEEIGKLLPEGEHFYPEDQVTDRSSRFLAAELVREKIMRQLGDELPYEMTVEIESFEDDGELISINALILVERDSQKSIVIGKGGKRLKLIGQEARKEMERMFDAKVMLKTWVKVKGGWSDDDRALRSLGYDDV
ncbi:GTPase Era [Sinobacterium norvegicum]|uniref:GTPase Era n=1 Tax=Sinobacterium norvegicum TaxID=1641715 RepID=A0ABN8EFJ5_9GAMM|nr:GTPase Era [Sinobacterium norvegicum]CAH0990413.1 GTPase Era [Sinobacterium norvegicum]